MIKLLYTLFFIYNINKKYLTYNSNIIKFGKNNANLDYDDYNTTVRIKYYNQLIKERKERNRLKYID